MRGPLILVFVLILATAGLLLTVWEFQFKAPLLEREPEPFAQKLENVGVSTAVIAVALIVPFWLLGGAEEDRQELMDSLRSAARVFEYTSDGVMLADKDGLILAVNPAFTHITGFAAKDALGSNVWMLLSAAHEAEFAKLMGASVKNKGDWRGEVLVRRKGGEQIPVLYTFSVVLSEGGETAGYVAVLARPSDKHRPESSATHQAQGGTASGSQSLAT